ATIFGGGVWTVHRWQRQFYELLEDPRTYARLLIDANQELQSPIVYVGSGYGNFLVAALGMELKEQELGPPELRAHIVKQWASELDVLDIKMIDKDPWIHRLWEAARLVSNEIGPSHIVAVTAYGPFTLAGQIYGVEQLMRAAIKNPSEAEKTLEFAMETAKQFCRPLLQKKQISMVCVVDPTASGDLISRRMFQKF